LDELDGAAYYFILIKVRSFKCKHRADPFPLLTRCGLHYVDKVYFALMLQHYEVQYDFVEGVAFDSVNNRIANVAHCLYSRRMQLKEKGSVAQLLIKRLLNSLWGKSIQNVEPTYEVCVAADALEGFKFNNQKFLYSIKEEGEDGRYRCRLVKELIVNWSRPQFAAAVLSASRGFMQEHIYNAVDNGVDIYMANTDSLTMTRQGFNSLHIVPSKDLGAFSVEVESIQLIALSAKKYVHRLKDNAPPRIRNSGRKIKDFNNAMPMFEAWFREKVARLKA
jgi:hypothetical protein